jgi:hypothetical protein
MGYDKRKIIKKPKNVGTIDNGDAENLKLNWRS